MALALVAVIPVASAQNQDKVTVYVSAGFEGNTWMDASLNLLRAIAKTPQYKDKVELKIQSASSDAHIQQQQINGMIQAGADIIIAWPISPTALNRSVHNACARGIVFMTWDAGVTEPCAYHVGINQKEAGAKPAQWLAKELNGKGNIIFMSGIPGNTPSDKRDKAAKSVFAQYPGIKIIAEAPSMWNAATARQKFSQIIAAKGWDAIDGVWTQTGCYQFEQLELQAHRNKFLPCAGNGTNGFRVAMLPKGTTEGAVGMPGASMGSPPWAAPYAFKLAMKILNGGKVSKTTYIPMPFVTQENNVLCKKADLAQLKAMDWKCAAVPLDLAPANYFIDVWSSKNPMLDLYSALNGTVPKQVLQQSQ
jgi:ribose transport system substrate-binding protein